MSFTRFQWRTLPDRGAKMAADLHRTLPVTILVRAPQFEIKSVSLETPDVNQSEKDADRAEYQCEWPDMRSQCGHENWPMCFKGCLWAPDPVHNFRGHWLWWSLNQDLTNFMPAAQSNIVCGVQTQLSHLPHIYRSKVWAGRKAWIFSSGHLSELSFYPEGCLRRILQTLDTRFFIQEVLVSWIWGKYEGSENMR